MIHKVIPFVDFGGKRQIIHFAHANGYPPECYRPLLSNLKDNFHLISMYQRPLWEKSDPYEISDWYPLSEDLINFFNQQGYKSVIAIGHSMGGICTLRAAINNPGRFRALVLIDPVLFSPARIYLIRLLMSKGLLSRYHPLIRRTSRRKRDFDDLDTIFANYRGKRIFRYLDDDDLKTCIAGITTPTENGHYKLVYSPDWEIRIYATGIWNDIDIWNGLPELKLPILFIRGNESDTFLPSAIKQIRRKLLKAKIITIRDTSHLVPLEKPRMISSIITKFLEENL